MSLPKKSTTEIPQTCGKVFSVLIRPKLNFLILAQNTRFEANTAHYSENTVLTVKHGDGCIML